jgi:hypothetical protein
MKPQTNKTEAGASAPSAENLQENKSLVPDFNFMDMKIGNKRIFSEQLDSLGRQEGNEVLAQGIVKKEVAKAVRKFELDFYEEAKRVDPKEASKFLPSDELNRELAQRLSNNLSRGEGGQIDMGASIRSALDSFYGLNCHNPELADKIPQLLSKVLDSEGAGAPFYKGKVMTRTNLFRLVAKELAEGKQVEDAELDLRKKKEKEEKERKKKLEEQEEAINESEF